jgi:hypothetical protein
MGIGDTGFHESLSFPVVLTLSERVTPTGELERTINKSLSNLVKVDEHSSSVSVIVEGFIQVLAMVNSADNFADDFGHSVDFALLRHEIYLIVQCLGNLED